MRTLITTRLDCIPERAWEAVQTTRLLKYVAAPLLVFEPLQPRTLPDVWQPGNYMVRIMFFGLIPIGNHWIMISLPQCKKSGNHRKYAIRDNGYGSMVKKWDHLIIISRTEDGKTQYTDQVDIEAAMFTPFIWLFSQVFYCLRQRRLRSLAKQKFVIEKK